MIYGLAVAFGITVGSIGGVGVAQATTLEYVTNLQTAEGISRVSSTYNPVRGGQTRVGVGLQGWLNVQSYGMSRGPSGVLGSVQSGPNVWTTWSNVAPAQGYTMVWWNWPPVESIPYNFPLSGRVTY
ncbi:hypothetical protein QFZ26_002402 [Agromyces ramosus]|uniref:Uncharacterized protein n=1 Tax=Agromyces ramosus TaxID=33879 RepID=A0ABU0RAS2_9MICO|nr:hypothetical protein [Agromyces ramosus]